MVSNIPINSPDFFKLRAEEKDRQRFQQIQDRSNNPDFVRDPKLSGLPKPKVVSCFARIGR